MNKRIQDILWGVAGSLMLAACGWGFGIVKFYGNQAANAASVADVQKIQTQIDHMPSEAAVTNLTDQIDKLTQTLGGIRYDLKTTKEKQEEQAKSLTALWKRHQYVWDSVTMICTKMEIICATRNAAFEYPGVPPWPGAPGDSLTAMVFLPSRRHSVAG